MKRVSLINDINEGGLKLPRIECMIDAQRITCTQTCLEDSPRPWKFILSYCLERVGGKVVFLCNYNFGKLPLELPRYYKGCLIAWTLFEQI